METTAVSAGSTILGFLRKELKPIRKADGTVVFDADLAANDYIICTLSRKYPEFSIISEEGGGDKIDAGGRQIFIVDPLDGSADFPTNKGISVLIALLERGRPKAGVVYMPRKQLLFSSSEKGPPKVVYRPSVDGELRFNSAEEIRPPPPVQVNEVRIGSSVLDPNAQQKIYDAFGIPPSRRISAGGMGARMMDMALRKTHVVVARPGKVSEWDVAAGHAILGALGLAVTDLHGDALVYNKPNPVMDKGVLVTYRELQDRFVSILKEHGY